MSQTFWPRWLLVNTVSFAIAAVLMGQLGRLPQGSTYLALGAGAIAATMIGPPQEVLLRKVLVGRHGLWTLAAIVGGEVGWVLGGVILAVFTTGLSSRLYSIGLENGLLL